MSPRGGKEMKIQLWGFRQHTSDRLKTSRQLCRLAGSPGEPPVIKEPLCLSLSISLNPMARWERNTLFSNKHSLTFEASTFDHSKYANTFRIYDLSKHIPSHYLPCKNDLISEMYLVGGWTHLICNRLWRTYFMCVK